MNTPLDKVLDICKTQNELANRVNRIDPSKKLTQSTIGAWKNRFNHRVGDGYVLVVSEAVEWEITPHQLRPDLYPHPQDGLPDHLREVA